MPETIAARTEEQQTRANLRRAIQWKVTHGDRHWLLVLDAAMLALVERLLAAAEAEGTV